MTKKIIYWVVGIVLALVVFMTGFHFWNGSQSSALDATNSSNSTSSSGSGNNNHNPAQEIQKHLQKMGF